MTRRGFGFVPNWGSSNRAPSRICREAYFPSSPAGTVRESTFAETIAGTLGADPSHEFDDLKDTFYELDVFADSELAAEEVWNAFNAMYVTSGKKGVRSSSAEAQDYMIPFHYEPIQRITIKESRNWHRWYWMLMTDSDGDFNDSLHKLFLDTITEEKASNLVEQLVIEAAVQLDGGENEQATEATEDDTRLQESIPPLIPQCAESFQKDLQTWLDLREEESLARWMQELRDIVCFHYMMYYIQLSMSLAAEYNAVQEGTEDEFTHCLEPIYFGLADETAAKARPFATEWEEREIKRAIYDSWGRLAVQRHLIETLQEVNHSLPTELYTLHEAVNEFPDDIKQAVVENLMAEFPDDQQPELSDKTNLREIAPKFSYAVRRYYTNKGSSESSQTAFTLGFNAVYQLGRGVDREFLERRRRVGTLAVLDRASIRLFARLFEAQYQEGHIREFWHYLRNRGIRLDDRSQNKLVQMLDEMGMVQKQSDGEEAVYVRTI